MEEIITKKIDKINFGVTSPAWVKKIVAVNVVSPELYDTDGYPVEKGLMDLAMGVIDPGLRCKTCGGRMRTCPGHFGYIQLAKPIMHILYASLIYDLLRSFCFNCGRILISPEKAAQWKEKIDLAKKENNIDVLHGLQKNLFSLLKKNHKCHYCGTNAPEITLEKPTTFYDGDRRIWPGEIRERMEKIPNEDLDVIGIDPHSARPEWHILTALLVPPITTRPSITLITGERSEDDLTHKLSDIVRVNQRLLENITAGAPEIIIEDLWDLLQYHLTTYFDNSVAQVPPARHKTNRPLKTLAQRLKGKEGRIRYNLAGKRVNFCARSVISPDPFININEVGVPQAIAKELTIPEKVTEWNIDWLKGYIKSGTTYPGASYVITPEGKRKKITEDTKEQILSELAPGWIVERNIINGDIALFNRQPSLHRMSLMGHRIKVLPDRTLKIHPAAIVPYNADFDGDEMNLHIPQTEEAIAEAENLMILDKQIITPRYGLSIVGEREDTLVGLYHLTADGAAFDRAETSEFLIAANIYTLPEKSAKKGDKEYFFGKDIFSMFLPGDLNFEYEGIKIENGRLVEGIITRKFVGAEEGRLIHALVNKYGPEIATDMMNKINSLGLAVVRRYPYTMSMVDLDLSKKAKDRIKEVIAAGIKDTKRIIRQYKEGKIIPIPGKTEKETREALILSALNKLRKPIGEIVEKEAKEDNNIVLLTKVGQAGLLNLSQTAAFAGQQVLRGKRIMSGYSRRVLPHFNKGDVGPMSHGFIIHGYSDGMDPIEMFFNSIVGRDSLMDTAMRTPKSGYMQRRLINALQDLRVNYDGTVRDAGQHIVQFTYGSDNVDVSKSDEGDLKIYGKGKPK